MATKINENGGFDSFEIQLHYEASIIKELLVEKKAELVAKTKNPHFSFSVNDFCRFKTEFKQLEAELNDLLSIPIAKDVITINDRYQPIKNCLARISPY